MSTKGKNKKKKAKKLTLNDLKKIKGGLIEDTAKIKGIRVTRWRHKVAEDPTAI
jgi:hypothetical protein